MRGWGWNLDFVGGWMRGEGGDAGDGFFDGLFVLE